LTDKVIDTSYSLWGCPYGQAPEQCFYISDDFVKIQDGREE